MIRLAVRLLLVMASAAGLFAAAPVAAQGQPFPAVVVAGWNPGVVGTELQATPDEACRVQWQQNNPGATFSDPTATDDWRIYNCNWSGGTPTLPATVRLDCPTGGGWQLTPEGLCLIATEQRANVACDCNGPISQTGTPFVGNPINLQSGDKVAFETDYSSADGLFVVSRFYHSGHRGRVTESPSEVAGFGRRWHGLLPGHVMVGGTNFSEIEYLPVNGGIAHFALSAGGDNSSFTYTASAPSRYRVSMLTTPSSTRAAYFQDPANTSNAAEMRLDFPNGDYLLLRRVGTGATQLGWQRMMVPVEHRLASGYARFFDYNGNDTVPYRIRDSFGRQMLLTWRRVRWRVPCIALANTICSGSTLPAQPVITNIVLPDGTSLVYDYDEARRAVGGGADDRLISVQRRSASNVVLDGYTYLYENNNYPYAMTGIVDRNGARLSTYSYDAAGFAASSEQAGGVNRYEVEHLRIDSDNLARVVTNPLGLETTYRYNRTSHNDSSRLLPRSLIAMDIAATPNVPAQTNSFAYSNDLMVQSVDGRGVVMERTNDAQGRPTQLRDAQGRPEARVTDIVWHPVWDLPVSETRGNLRLEYDYDAQGRMVARREVDLTTHSVPYATNGQTRQWSYTYSSAGRLLTANGPRPVNAAGKDDVDSFAYDATGNLTSITNGLGQVTSFSGFDANGRPAQMTDANGVVTQFVYDALGRMTSLSVREPGAGTAHATTSFDYDIEGRVTGITRPATARLGMTYDLAGRLLSISAPTGEAITFTYDAMGNITRQRVTTAAGAQRSDIQRTFDELGRLLTESYGIGRTASYAYDPQGNPVRVTSPRSFATDQAFDGLARLIQTVHPDTGTETSSYNSNDDLTGFTDPLSVATTFTYNGFGQLIQEVSPDRGTSTYEYNTGGDLIAATDGRGQRVEFTYDILGRVLTRTPVGLAGQQVSYAYDTASISGSYSVGRLATITDASGTTRFKYDHRGNVVTRQQVIAGSPTLTLSMTYDLADRILRITYPSGRWVDYARDAQGRVASISMLRSGAPSVTQLTSGMTYEPFGALATASFGNGQTYAQVRDDTGRLTARRYQTTAGANIWSVGYSYDADDNITAITDLVQPSRDLAFQYDGTNRLSRVDMATGTTRREDYVHDLGGNRIRVERRAAVTDPAPTSQDTYTRTAGTNRIASVTTPAGTRSFTHDARGNRIAEDRPGTNDVTVGYDGFARLTSYVRTGEASLAMTYNGMDQRVTLVSGGVTRRFVYDQDGRLLGEYGPNGSQFFAEYVWMLPEVGDAGAFGGDDGTGGWTPLAVAASNGAGATQTFQWLHTSHLGVPNGSYNASGAATTLSTITLLGFPGQTQALADLYYNQYRDYDPTTGRYIQADPIGLAGDVNPYVYAGANPVAMVDPLGLTVKVVTSDPVAARRLMEDYARLKRSRRGREIARILEESEIEYQIRPLARQAFYCRSSSSNPIDLCHGRRAHTVYIDPYRLLSLPTTCGFLPTPPEVLLGHELGHAVGEIDDGPNRMNNVNENENLIRFDLGYPRRTSYIVPEIVWTDR